MSSILDLRQNLPDANNITLEMLPADVQTNLLFQQNLAAIFGPAPEEPDEVKAMDFNKLFTTHPSYLRSRPTQKDNSKQDQTPPKPSSESKADSEPTPRQRLIKQLTLAFKNGYELVVAPGKGMEVLLDAAKEAAAQAQVEPKDVIKPSKASRPFSKQETVIFNQAMTAISEYNNTSFSMSKTINSFVNNLLKTP
ncbi:MAG: hypothetical protein ACO2ZM_06335 [Francisellaceae bacterium]